MSCSTKQTACRPPKGQKMPFLSLVTLTFDLQTRLSEAPNMSSVRIWRKYVRRFPRYFIHKKTQTDGAKNRTLRSSLRAVMTCGIPTHFSKVSHTRAAADCGLVQLLGNY